MKIHIAAVLLALVSFFTGCSQKDNGYQGYVDVEYTNLSAQISDTILSINALKGTQVHRGDLLLQLDDTKEKLALEELKSQLEGAKNVLADMRSGKRLQEQEIIEAQLVQAQASLDNAYVEYQRYKSLYDHQAISPSVYDAKETVYKTAKANVESIQHQLSLSKEGTREYQIKAQQSAIEQIDTKIKEAQYSLSLKHITAPSDASVFDVYYHEGEFLPAGHVALRLVEPGQIKARFFVPSAVAADLRTGEHVRIDTGEKELEGEITYISPVSEYTPPVIYSNESNKRLVFMVEAKPQKSETKHLLIGQPLKVHIDDAR